MTYRLTQEQLQQLMEETARKAAEESIKNFLSATDSHLEVVDDEPAEDNGAPVSTNTAISVSKFTGEQYKAHVKEISPQVKANGTVTIHASIPYNKHLLPGMSASVHKK